MQQRLSWVGLSVGDYVIRELLGEGTFSWVFRAVHNNGSTVKAFKIGKPAEVIAEGGPTSCIPTKALMKRDGVVSDMVPDSRELLRLQAQKLQELKDPSVIEVEELVERSAGSFYRMPVIPGQNLRRYMMGGPVAISVFYDLAKCLSRLKERNDANYHGDLKPENVMVTPSGAVLIDPGYFGNLHLGKGKTKHQVLNCAVTSPLYYPCLEPDDLLAFGFMLWEAACREQPLSKRVRAKDFDPKHAAPELYQKVLSEEEQGNFFLSPILGIKKPSDLRPGIPAEVEKLILKAVRLAPQENGSMELAAGYTSFAQIADDLVELTLANITSL